MKFANIIPPVIFAILFFLIVENIPKSKKMSGSVNYAPNGYTKTIKAGINDSVISAVQNGLYWVTFKKGQKLPFSYDISKMNATSAAYPANFISSGDSIYKKSDNDTFYLIRNRQRWLFVLPCCP
jgi:hypothetical protein